MQKEQYKILSELENTHWWFLAKKEFIKNCLPKPNKKLKILDLGCGTGGTSVFLENWGTVDRIEVSPYACTILRKKGVKFKRGNIETSNLGRNKYDLICILDVLYHKSIKDIDKILLKSNFALKKGGLILIMDCALPFFYSKHDKIMHAGRRFYLSSLIKKVEQANFQVIKKSYIYFFLFPLFMINRIANKFFNFPTVSRVNNVLNKILFHICRLESFFLQYVSFPIGSSVVILAHKI